MGGRNKREEKESRGERMKRREREREGGKEKNRRRKKEKIRGGGEKAEPRLKTSSIDSVRRLNILEKRNAAT